MEEFNHICITRTAATVNELLEITCHGGASGPVDEVLYGASDAFSGKKCDRVFLYNPDAVAMWIYEKYKTDFAPLENRASLRLPMLSVVPPVTPVCFASMYSGMMPEYHGILKYEKPVLKVKTIFDDIAEAGKKAAIVSTRGDSISLIFKERQIDYYIYPTKQECNSKAMELIQRDEYDCIVLYNGDYDHEMHRHGPEGKKALSALRENIADFNKLFDSIGEFWQDHNTVMAFAPDHGCHRSCLFLGNHGVEEPCDMNIMHFYGFIPARNRGMDRDC